MIFFERQTAYDCFSQEDHWNATERGYPMVNFTLRKLLGMIPMLLIITFLIYAGIELMPGDVIDFVCDYYSYDGEYLDSYMLGDQLIVDGELIISDVYVDEENSRMTYLFTDIYNQQYWSEPVK